MADKPSRPARSDPARTLPPRRRLIFGFGAVVLVPLLVLGALEVALRLAGVGYPTSFFLRSSQRGHLVYGENSDFGRRFFPKGLARIAPPLVMQFEKPAKTCRVFILGESAALGDPEPSFGFGRYLEVLLRERFPGTRFEVVCTAITAINSHSILPIARECAQHQGDVWVIYMGNNEVVGPFGGGTVLGAKAPPLAIIRATLVLKELRLGQEFSDLLDQWRNRGNDPATWQGMKMFLNSQTRPEDPARLRTERNFETNLKDILRVAERAGVKVVLCTVASNLEDTAPFASLHALDFGAAQQTTWDAAYSQGQKAATEKRWSDAVASFTKAARTDPDFAELQFQLGRAYLNLTNRDEARRSFEKARDFDALPFRTSARLNRIIRDCAQEGATHGVSLVDAEQEFARSSPDGIPGRNLFYEHVHLNFAGNYLLARLVAEQASHSLPADVLQPDRHEWASEQKCEQALALTDWDRHRIYESIYQREGEAPFTMQLNHSEQLQFLQRRLEETKAGMTRAEVSPALAAYHQALDVAPDDFLLRANLAKLLLETGDLADAAAEWERVQELLPGRPGPTLYLGRALFRLGKLPEAERAFREIVRSHPEIAEAWDSLAQDLLRQKRFDESLAAGRHALKLQPSNAVLHIHMADTLAAAGKRSDAISSLEEAVRCRPDYWEPHYLLGIELAMEQRFSDAQKQFAAAVQGRPQFAPAHLNLGVAMAKLNRFDEALRQFQIVTRLEPTNQAAQKYISQLEALRNAPQIHLEQR